MTRSAAPRKDETTGTWWFVVDLGPGPDGKRRQARRRGFPTKKAAQEELDRLRVRALRAAIRSRRRYSFVVATAMPAMVSRLFTTSAPA